MTQYSLKINSFIGSDTRIQVVKERSPKRELYGSFPLDRNSESETNLKNEQDTDKNTRRIRRSPRTQNRLSPHARAILQRIGGAVDVFFDAANAIFLTGTFPGESYAYQSAIADQAGWIVHRLKAWIYKRCGANIAWWAWEFQGRGTLHLHYIAVIPCDADRDYILSEFRSEWIRLIKGASERSNVNLFIGRRGRDFFTEKELLQIYAEQVYSSGSAYLAKYIAKKKSSKFPSPCRLWGCTKEARNLVAKHCISLIIPSLSLHRAEDKAYKYDSYSNAPAEKRRFFRHRFSQGFTILLYDDKLREAIVVDDKQTDFGQDLISSIARINEMIIALGVSEQFRSLASKPLRGYLSRSGLPIRVMLQVYSDDEVLNNLIEMNSLAGEIHSVNYWERNNLRNAIGAAIKCLK